MAPFVWTNKRNNVDPILAEDVNALAAAIAENIEEIAFNKIDITNNEIAIQQKVDKINGMGLSEKNYTADEKAKLAGIPADAEANVQSDWWETDADSDAYIKHKPDIVTPAELEISLQTKVDKVAGMDLSENDFADYYKAMLDGIENHPSKGSSNLITSGGVYNAAGGLSDLNTYYLAYRVSDNTPLVANVGEKVDIINDTDEDVNAIAEGGDTFLYFRNGSDTAEFVLKPGRMCKFLMYQNPQSGADPIQGKLLFIRELELPSIAPELIEQDDTHLFVSDEEKSTWNNKASANYSSATIIVAASDTVLNGRNAHYICSANNAQTTIQTAINALPANGGKIVLLEGTYNISNEIALNKANITIEGMGRGATVLQTSGSNTIFNITSSDCKVSDMTIKQSNSSRPLGKGGIITSGWRTTVRDVKISGFCYGISNRGIYAIIDSLYAEENTYGIYLSNGNSRATISNCLLMSNDYGIGIDSAKSDIFDNCLHDNNNAGIWLTNYGTPNYNKIHDNYITCGNGVPDDYDSSQYTILVQSPAKYNDFSNNYILGKNYVNSGGSTNTFNNNRYE